MGLADAFQPQNDAAINDLVNLPPPPPQTAPPKWNGWSAPLRAIPAAVAESLAGGAEAITALSRSNMPGNVVHRAGPEVRGDNGLGTTEVSRSLRNVANDYRPDPLTAGTAENIFFGVTKGLTKALGYTLAAGPFGGAALFAGDEGATTFDDLQRAGVDDTTAAKVGLLAGGVAGASLLLPVAAGGATTAMAAAKTAALVAVSGPAAFIAQQAATREILRSANYGAIAEQYDPLDPAGLAVATLIPAVFGGLHVRSLAKARAGDAARPAEVAALPAEPAAVAPAPRALDVASPEAVDAAMTHNLSLRQDAEAVRPPDPLPLPDPTVRQPDAEPVVAPKPAATEGEVDPIVQRAQVIEQAFPDLPVRIDESGKATSAAEEMAAVRREAQEGTDTELGHMDADLMRVAAECAITTGSA